MISESEPIIKEYFWKKMCQLKFDLTYYGLCFSRCVSLVRIRKSTFAFLTALFAGAWMEWSDNYWISHICPIAMFILQVISAVIEFLPHDDRQIELREMMELLEPVYRKMENDWVSISIGEYTVEEIKELTTMHQARIDDVKSRFFRNDSLPQYEKMTKQAISETNKYYEEAMKMEDKNNA